MQFAVIKNVMLSKTQSCDSLSVEICKRDALLLLDRNEMWRNVEKLRTMEKTGGILLNARVINRIHRKSKNRKSEKDKRKIKERDREN